MRDLAGVAMLARILLYAQAAAAGFAAVLGFVYPGISAADASMTYAATGLLQFIIYIAGGIAVLRWIYLANTNVHALGAEGISATPGWAVGYYFIPIANLFLPFQSMQEIWKASTQPRDWEPVPAPITIGLWWFFWIVSNIVGIVALRLSLETDLMSDPGRTYELLTAVSDILTVPASLLLASIIADVTARQQGGKPAAIFS